jgi:hypothetical protein
LTACEEKQNVPVVPGFKYDLFVSYAHLDDVPFQRGGDGWVTEFILALQVKLKARSREFNLWFDPQLRTGDDFNMAIAQAISNSAAFLCILSPAYEDSAYCKREVAEFRAQRHPAFGLKVGSLSRMQAVLLEDLPETRWPPELRVTSPYRFFTSLGPNSKPAREDENSAYVQGLWKVRESIWALLDEMRKQKERGIAVDQPYDMQESQAEGVPVVYLAEVADDLFYKRENLRSALDQLQEFRVELLPDEITALGPAAVSVHLFGRLPGRPAPGHESPVARMQLEAILKSNPARRPLVWLARDLKPEDAETSSHHQFLDSLLRHNGIELLRTTFEDLKEEIQTRMRPKPSPARKNVRRRKGDPVVHIWHQPAGETPLDSLKDCLKRNNCGISVFAYSPLQREMLQSKLAFCDGLVLPYTSRSKSWAEDIMTEAFQLRRREERPFAFAAVELSPAANAEFNFEHPSVVAIHAANGGFHGMDTFLSKLEEEDV